MAPPIDAWLGTWRLDPSTLRYEHGRPGRRALERDGRVVDHWRRELAADGASITFTQTGTTPEGRPFKNRSVYYRA